MIKRSRQPVKLIKRSEMIEFFQMPEAIACMETAFASLSSGECYVPKRYIMSTWDESLTLLLKPASMDSQKRSGIKVLAQRNMESISGIPTITGIVILIDNETGEIVSIMDGEFITAIRTGAASGLATRYLSRENSRTLALFGCGTQGRTPLQAVNAVRTLETVWIFEPLQKQADAFIREMQASTPADIVYTEDLSVLREADIICTATNSMKPLFSKNHLKKGAHINAIGSYKPEMRELNPDIIQSSRVYLDDMDSCLNESGDLIEAVKAPGVMKANIMGEIGDVVLKRIPGRTDPGQVTVFKSVGTAIQDLVTANRIYDRSLTENFGSEVRLYD